MRALYPRVAEMTWEKIFSIQPRAVFGECRQGIRGAKVLGDGYLHDVQVTGLRGEFHRYIINDRKEPCFFLTQVRVDGVWLSVDNDFSKQHHLPIIYGL